MEMKIEECYEKLPQHQKKEAYELEEKVYKAKARYSEDKTQNSAIVYHEALCEQHFFLRHLAN